MAEANVCGTPVVAFDVGPASEVVAHGVTGFVIAPGSIEDFCEGVSATDRIRPEGCRRHVERCFSTARMVKDHMGLYDRLTAGPAETSPREEAP